MHRSDAVAGLLMTVLGLIMIFIIAPRQISGTSDYGIAPDVFPLTLLWLLVILSASLGVHRLAKWSSLKYEPILSRADWLFIFGSVVYFSIAYLAIAKFGFRVAGPLLLLALLFLTGALPGKKIQSVLVAVSTPLILYYLFWKIFRIPLP